MLRKIQSSVRIGNVFLGYVSGLGILLMGGILCYEVIVRYFFNSPTVWVQEVAVYLFMWAMLAGASYTLMLGKHVRIDLVFDHLPVKLQLFFDAVTSLIGMGFSLLVSYQTFLMIVSSFKYNKVSATMLRVPLWLIQLPLLLGFALLSFQFFFIIVERLMMMKHEDGGNTNG